MARFEDDLLTTRKRLADALARGYRDHSSHVAAARVAAQTTLNQCVEAERAVIERAVVAAWPGTTPSGTSAAARWLGAWSDAAWTDSGAMGAAVAGGPVTLGQVQLADLPGRPAHRPLPVVVPLFGARGLLLSGTGAELDVAAAMVRALTVRMLGASQPGRVRFVAIDNPGLGRAFAPLLGLSETIRGPKVYHEPREVSDALEAVSVHMGMVIQKYLTHRYDSISAYNRDAGAVAEPWRVVLVHGFPKGFSAESAERLLTIARNGPKVGVQVVIVRDTQHKLPHEFSLADLERCTTTLSAKAGAWTLGVSDFPSHTITFWPEPPPAVVERVVSAVNAGASDADRVEVPFDALAPRQRWAADARHGLIAPVGRRGARDTLDLRFGVGTEHHLLVGGIPGSGKTVLLHSLLCSLCLTYGPDELEVYLVDFKEGVEFAAYRELPHARVVAVEAEREYGLSVLEGLRDELTRRGDLARGVGSNLVEYRDATGNKLARILLVVDEFQVFFQQNDRLAATARALLDDLCRRGRAFGIHVVLATQTLGAADLDPTTLSSLPVRVALKMSESDSQRLLGRDNDEARHLARPGEAIYNPQGGLPVHNVKFQVAYVSNAAVAKLVAELKRAAADQGFKRTPMVFDGTQSAQVVRNPALVRGLRQRPTALTRSLDVWLGEPTVLQDGHARIRLARQAQGNVVFVGTDDALACRCLFAALWSVAAQVPTGQGQALVLGLPAVDSPVYDLLEDVCNAPFPVELGEEPEVASFVERAAAELVRRRALPVERGRRRALEPPWLLVVFGLQRARDLKRTGASPPPAARALFEILRDGPALGIHTLVWADTPSTLAQVFQGPEVREFGCRVALSAGEPLKVLAAGLTLKLKPGTIAVVSDEQPDRCEKIRTYGAFTSEVFDVRR
jgi:hypothetical protein